MSFIGSYTKTIFLLQF